MIDLKKIPEEEKTPLVIELLQTIERLNETIRQLIEEIARLKGHKGKPRIPPSSLEKDPEDTPKKPDGKRPGSEKRSKTADLKIHETIDIPPVSIPPGSKFEGYDDYVVQGLKISLHNIRYRLECWRDPSGNRIKGKLPDSVNGHFSPELRGFILQQNYHCHVTQPLLLDELRDLRVDISSGEISRILTENHDVFHGEKDGILPAGLEVSGHIHVDDTSARHAGKNGYCTHIGNDLFAWFESTDSKSRINFLKLLRNVHGDYVINDDALEYMAQQSLPQSLLEKLAIDDIKHLQNEDQWTMHLNHAGICNERHVRIATEGALLGSILHHGFSKDLAIVSDDAGQFNVLLHALCWIHAERTIHKLVPCSEKEKIVIEDIRKLIWQLYRDLKAYKKVPEEVTKKELDKRFDELFATRTCCEPLNAALRRLANNKRELLLVLERPDVPLHNNDSERDIREYVKKRKISGSTRSADGRRCRDTFASLKKTCRKLGISFWEYLNDRVLKANRIPPLPDLIRLSAQAP
jgi:hypothetical protein